MGFEEEEILEDEYRSPEEISVRAIILFSLIKVVFGEDPNTVFNWLKAEGLWNNLSPYEIEFAKDTKIEKARINISWRSEALASLLWSIEKIERLLPLNEQIDFAHLSRAVPCFLESTSSFVCNSKLRDTEEIDAEYERIFDSHWKVRDARIHNKTVPNDIDSGIVMERHYGLNYVIGYCGLPWDEITTDT